jgi:hypothetical protein
MPTVADLTEQVLSARHAARWAGRFVVLDGPPPNAWDVVDPDGELIQFVHALYARAERFYSKNGDEHPINYEDIAFLASQVADCLNFEYENPALDPLIEALAAEHTGGDESELATLADEAREYVTSTVASCLGRPPQRLDHLALITDACRVAGRADLATLNHDTVLEQALRLVGIAYSDGFERAIAERSDAWTDTYSATVRLFKLHGSINWYRYRIGGEQVIVRTDADDPIHLRDLNGELLEFPADGRGQFLAGTFNKILAYQSPVYAEQHARFRTALQQADILVICGYGFADKAINTHLTTYIYDASDRPIVLIHGDREGLLEGARFAAMRALREVEQRGRLVLIDGWVQNTSWSDVTSRLP